MNLISDLTKEIIKDVNGQKIYYYPINELKTVAHGVYNEAMQKVFDNPIALDALVDNSFETETKTNAFGIDSQYKIEAYVQWRDIVDKGIIVSIGDFFSFSDVFYEISDKVYMRNIYGQAEHRDGMKITGVKAREGAFEAVVLGPTDIKYTDKDAVQTTFEQQRGQATNSTGPTGDVRTLQKDGVLDAPLTTAKQVSSKGDVTGAGSAFYDEDD
jgi:hypothetical protein